MSAEKETSIASSFSLEVSDNNSVFDSGYSRGAIIRRSLLEGLSLDPPLFSSRSRRGRNRLWR